MERWGSGLADRNTQTAQGLVAWARPTQQRHQSRGSGIYPVYPASGWWRTPPVLKQYDRVARYALIVGIKAPETDVDLCAEVDSRVGAPVMVGT